MPPPQTAELLEIVLERTRNPAERARLLTRRGRFLAGDDSQVETLPLAAGTLTVFKGKDTAHRVTPVEGPRPRIVAVFSYYERPDVQFGKEERLGFYGRAG